MPEWLFDFLSGPTIKIAAAIWNSSMKLIIKAGLQYATKVFYRNMGICQKKTCIRGQRGSDSLL